MRKVQLKEGKVCVQGQMKDKWERWGLKAALSDTSRYVLNHSARQGGRVQAHRWITALDAAADYSQKEEPQQKGSHLPFKTTLKKIILIKY